MATPPSRVTPILPQINIGSYGSGQFGTPPGHIFGRATPTNEDFHSCRDDSSGSSGFHDVIADGESDPECGEDPLAEESGSADDKSPTPAPRQKLTGRQIVTLVILMAGNISSAMFYSLLAPFFATEATQKGATLFEVGLIFGSFQFIQFFMSPVFGNNMTKLGSKFLFVAGNFMCSGCGILFGCLQWSPNGVTYVVTCFVLRSFEAVGAAAQSTATFAIGAYTFPGHISVVMGILQAASCIGLVCGPPIGGLLYSAGDYYLPFVVTGSMFMFFSICSFFYLPSAQDEQTTSSGSPASKLRLLRIPIVPVVGFLTLISQATIGFVDVALAAHLQQVQEKISVLKVGLIFLVPALLVVVSAPIVGLVGDKYKKCCRPLIIFGTVAGGVGFLGVGPCPLLTFLPAASIKSIIIALVVSAVGWGSLVLTYQEYVTAARMHGFADGMETQGIISGVNGAFNSLGALLGPSLGGVMVQKMDFPWASSVFAFGILLSGVVLTLYVIIEAACGCAHESEPPPTTSDERTPLLNEGS